MKLPLLLRLGMLMVIMNGVAQAQSPTVHLDSISICSVSAWNLSIKPDGSGTISFGANPENFGRFPFGTFDVAELHKKLVATSTPQNHIDADHIMITFASIAGTPTNRSTSDTQQAYNLGMAAIQSLTFNKDHM